jgi:membrane protein DedA with SNARE-associated domain
MRYVARLKWIQKHQNQIEICGHFFDRHIGKTMFVIRFTPGIRTPALLAAGMLRVHFGTYTLYSCLSCLFQSTIITFFMPYLYAPAIAWLKGLWGQHPAWVITIITAFFIAFCVAQWFIAKAVMRHLTKKNAH